MRWYDYYVKRLKSGKPTQFRRFFVPEHIFKWVEDDPYYMLVPFRPPTNKLCYSDLIFCKHKGKWIIGRIIKVKPNSFIISDYNFKYLGRVNRTCVAGYILWR